MTPPLDKPAPTELDLNSPEALARATAHLRALGVDDEVVLSAKTPEELFEYLDRTDPILAALARAPIGKPFTPEQRAELDQDLEDIRTGRAILIPHEERQAWREMHAAELAHADGE